eukprot:7636323-Alexandrium_andersonii.AAC.1
MESDGSQALDEFTRCFGASASDAGAELGLAEFRFLDISSVVPVWARPTRAGADVVGHPRYGLPRAARVASP